MQRLRKQPHAVSFKKHVFLLKWRFKLGLRETHESHFPLLADVAAVKTQLGLS